MCVCSMFVYSIRFSSRYLPVTAEPREWLWWQVVTTFVLVSHLFLDLKVIELCFIHARILSA